MANLDGIEERRQSRWAWIVAGLAVLTTLIPYLIGASMADGRRFMWLGYNLDDSCVYLSWMRQAADGSYRALNLFTTDAQHGMALNPLFLVLGRIAGWTHLPLIAVYHGSRLLFGLALLRLVWSFITLTVADARARKLAFLFVCFSSGLGWLPGWWSSFPTNTPVDKWQPEAVTYLSLYLSPLFCFSMGLQVAVLILLFCGVRTGRMRYAVGAGLCGLVLGAVHTYDILSLAAVWIVYLIIHTAAPVHAEPPRRAANWLQACVAGLITAPSVFYIYMQLKTEAVFLARAAVKTLSPPPVWVLLGYGIPLIFAVIAALVILKRRRSEPGGDEHTAEPEWITGRDAGLLLGVWAIVNFAVAYIPTSIQRKLLQGTHFPIAILAGIGAAWLLLRLKPAAKPWQVGMKMAVLTLLVSLTNLFFLRRDITNYAINRAQTQMQRTYLQPGEIEALEWIRDHSKEADAVQPLPWITRSAQGSTNISDEAVACFTPGLIHRRVYCGHWGETPDFGGKLHDTYRLERASTTDEERKALLRRMKVRYLVFSQKSAGDETEFVDAALPLFRGRVPLPPYLQLVHGNEDADVYEVSPDL